MAVSAHQIAPKNPTGRMAYGHTYGGYSKVRKLKLTQEYFICYLVISMLKCCWPLQYTIHGLQKALSGYAWLHRATNH